MAKPPIVTPQSVTHKSPSSLALTPSDALSVVPKVYRAGVKISGSSVYVHSGMVLAGTTATILIGAPTLEAGDE